MSDEEKPDTTANDAGPPLPEGQNVEFFNRPNPLQSVMIPGKKPGIDLEAIEEAEKALEDLADNFDNWMKDDIKEFRAAVDKTVHHGLSQDVTKEIFRLAHTIRGDGPTYGFPMAADAANSFCNYLEACEYLGKPSLEIVRRFAEAIFVMAEKNDAESDNHISEILSEALRVVATDHASRAEKKKRLEREAAQADKPLVQDTA